MDNMIKVFNNIIEEHLIAITRDSLNSISFTSDIGNILDRAPYPMPQFLKNEFINIFITIPFLISETYFQPILYKTQYIKFFSFNKT